VSRFMLQSGFRSLQRFHRCSSIHLTFTIHGYTGKSRRIPHSAFDLLTAVSESGIAFRKAEYSEWIRTKITGYLATT
jgi:hypothetical protein